MAFLLAWRVRGGQTRPAWKRRVVGIVPFLISTSSEETIDEALRETDDIANDP
jgi:hypothetical protein